MFTASPVSFSSLYPNCSLDKRGLMFRYWLRCSSLCLHYRFNSGINLLIFFSQQKLKVKLLCAVYWIHYIVRCIKCCAPSRVHLLHIFSLLVCFTFLPFHRCPVFKRLREEAEKRKRPAWNELKGRKGDGEPGDAKHPAVQSRNPMRDQPDPGLINPAYEESEDGTELFSVSTSRRH